jgi:chromate reductase
VGLSRDHRSAEEYFVKILLLCGSLRARSSNREMLRAAVLIAPPSIDFTWYDSLAMLPQFNPDAEEAGRLGNAAGLRDAVADADALIICSPEYAHGVPGALKNALDWLVGGPEMVGKHVALWQASTGLSFAPVQLAETLRTMSATVCVDAALTMSLRGGARDAIDIARDPALALQIHHALAALAHIEENEMSRDPFLILRGGALALPETHEVEAWGAPTFRVRNKMFAMYIPVGCHGVKRPEVLVKSTTDNQQFMVSAEPDRYFVPAYMGPRGWVGMYLDQDVEWSEVAELLVDGYRMVAGSKLLKQFPV